MAKIKEARLPVEVGCRVEKRGFTHMGTVIDRNEDWCSVKWDNGPSRESPRICHANELKTIRV